MHKFVNTIIEFLEIKKPYRLIFKPTIKPKKALATHMAMSVSGKHIRHDINLSLSMFANPDETRTMESIIAHEFVHAWQAEYRPNSAVHGRVFQNKAKELEDYLVSKGFAVSALYMKGIDV